MCDDASGPALQLARQVSRYVERRCETGEYCSTDVDGLIVMQNRAPTDLTGTLYQPVLCLILQGAKEIRLGSRVITCGPGASVIVSHTLPIQSRITAATPAEPYVAMILDLDIRTLRTVIDELENPPRPDNESLSIAVDQADVALVDAMRRLFELNHDRQALQVLTPLITREIHYRLLTAAHGGMLRQLLARNSYASRISTAIGRIRDDFSEPLSISELAAVANMSPSSFHEHFKAVTGTSPIQYQKDLRMLEARRLLTGDQRSVTETAFAVGYQSPAQFSRDYSRKFGNSPQEDKPRVGATR